MADLVEIEREMSFMGWGGRNGRAYIVNQVAGAKKKPLGATTGAQSSFA